MQLRLLISSVCVYACVWHLYVYTYAYMHLCQYVCTYVYMYLCMQARMFMCIFVCMYVRSMYIHLYTYTSCFNERKRITTKDILTKSIENKIAAGSYSIKFKSLKQNNEYAFERNGATALKLWKQKHKKQQHKGGKSLSTFSEYGGSANCSSQKFI